MNEGVNIPVEDLKLNSETIERTPPEAGGTVIVMQRHGNYDRETGHLSLDGKNDTLERSHRMIQEMIEKVPAEERKFVSLLVVASPTIKNEGQRSMETASAVIESAKEVFQQYGVPHENIITPTPRASEDIEEPRIFKGDTTYWRFLVDKYGKGTKEFWKAYEDDVHEEQRREMGAEGPIEMSDRFAHFTNILGRYAHLFHSNHSDEPARLIIWNVSHFDTITVYVKNHVAKIPQTEYVPVDYDGGVSLMIDQEDKASITINGKVYPVELTAHGTSIARHEWDKEEK